MTVIGGLILVAIVLLYLGVKAVGKLELEDYDE